MKHTNGPSGGGMSAVALLMAVNIAVFILQSLPVLFRSEFPIDLFALTGENISSGKIWTFLTYSFLHDPGSLFHILGNMLMIFFIGRILEPMLGTQKFCILYFGGVFAGALLWILVNGARPGHSLIGASGGTYALLIFICVWKANERMTLLLFFVLPVTMKPKWVAWIAVAWNGFGFVFQEIPNAGAYNTAYSGHVGGMIVGFVLYKMYMESSKISFNPSNVKIEAPDWVKKKTAKMGEKRNFTVNIDRQSLQKEVDRILDKINDKGFGALTEDEKKTLDRAKDILKK